MDKKKIMFIVLTVVSVVVSAIACAFGIPYTAVDIDYGWLENGDEPSPARISAPGVVEGCRVAVFVCEDG